MDINPYAAAMNNPVIPGSFVPDISPQAPQGPASELLPDGSAGGVAATATSFRDTVKELLGKTNDQMVDAAQKSSDLALGKTNDIEGTVKANEEASLAFQMTLAVRNKLLDTYTEVEKMQF